MHASKVRGKSAKGQRQTSSYPVLSPPSGVYALICGEQYIRHSLVRSCFAFWFHMSTARTRIIARAFSMHGGIVVLVWLFVCLSVCLSFGDVYTLQL